MDMPEQLTFADLFFLHENKIAVDVDDFASVLEHENKSWDIGSCGECGAQAFEQHQMECKHASVLWEPNWAETVKGPVRIAAIKRPDGTVLLRACQSQEAAMVWITEHDFSEDDITEVFDREHLSAAVKYWLLGQRP